MRHPIKLLSTVFLLLFILSGCTTLSKKECTEGDWYGIGYRDGAEGYSDERVNSHRKSCSEHGRTLDLNEYRRGRRDGLVQFCTRANGYKKGSNGWNLKEICPDELAKTFLDGYLAGVISAREKAELALQQTKWRYKQKQRSLEQEKDNKKRKELNESLSDLDREVERLFKEVQQLQQLEHKADFLYHQQ